MYKIHTEDVQYTADVQYTEDAQYTADVQYTEDAQYTADVQFYFSYLLVTS